MKLTLDWNCVIEVEECRPQADAVRKLVDHHRSGDVEVALLAASASENTKSMRFPGNSTVFHERVGILGWSDLPIVRMPAVYGLSYWGFAYYPNRADLFEEKMAALWAVIAPKIDRSPKAHLAEGVKLTFGNIQSKELAKWRNTWCDVISAYCHIREARDLFVTNNTRDFQSNAVKLATLGLHRIATPDEAAAEVKFATQGSA